MTQFIGDLSPIEQYYLTFVVIKLPLTILYSRIFVRRQQRSPFVQQASWFEDVVIRCIRYAFAYIPAHIGRVFFSKEVSTPFLRFRMLRHGYFWPPIRWYEVKKVFCFGQLIFKHANKLQRDFEGLWIIDDESQEPDIVIYYAHGKIT